MRSISVFVLCLLLCAFAAGCGGGGGNGGEVGGGDEGREDGFENTVTLAYVPMDDRPVNVDRVIYLSESVGYELKMPDSDLYRTHLDNQLTNSNGTQYGDRAALLDWLKITEADCYVLSLDQMLSGGLVYSRMMIEDNLDETFSYIDQILTAIGDKPAVLFDSVMRLASTVGFYGYESAEYDRLRAYGAIARKQFGGDELTVENIVANYGVGTGGDQISHADLSDEVIERYFACRERKLRISEYYLDKVKDKSNIYTYIGVDDSNPKVTVQTNEINFIDSKITEGVVFSGIDEFGLMGVTKLYLRNFADFDKVNINYYGGGENNAADEYDTGTLKDGLEGHLASLGITHDRDADMQIMVLTANKKTSEFNAAADRMAADVAANIAAGKPTAVMDVSGNVGRLQNKLITNTDLGMLLSYSSWNTGANTIGCCITNGLCRYAYLSHAKVTDEGHAGFLKALAFSFIKDVSYKNVKREQIEIYVRNNVGATSNFYSTMTDEAALNAEIAKIMSAKNSFSDINVLKNINSSKIIASIAPYKTAEHKAVSVSNYHFPWYRTFEMSFDITVA